MNDIFKAPPLDKSLLTPPDKLVRQLQILIGTRFQLTGKTRTDGSKIRKLIVEKVINVKDRSDEFF